MLTGIRVLDFSRYLPGPFATLRLADWGAEVIKIEPPEGDPIRQPREQDDGDGYVFRAHNRGKKSVVLNLKDAKDREIALDLMRTADVMVESFRPGVAKRLGISYEDALKVNPSIIYCSLTGYGQSGPMHHMGSHEINYMALSGFLTQLKDREGRPIHPTHTMADLVVGIAASEAILAALVQRGKTGLGCHLDIATADVMVSLMINHIMVHSATGEKNGIAVLNNQVVCYALYETKDGRYVSLAAMEKKFWKNFCKAVDREDWLPHQFTPPSENNPVYQEIRALFKERTFAEWCSFALEVDCCLTPVLETEEIIDHPYIKARQLIIEQEGLHYTLTRPKEQTAIKGALSYPRLGEHTEEVVSSLQKK